MTMNHGMINDRIYTCTETFDVNLTLDYENDSWGIEKVTVEINHFLSSVLKRSLQVVEYL